MTLIDNLDLHIGRLVLDTLTRRKVRVEGISVGIGRCGMNNYPTNMAITGYWIEPDMTVEDERDGGRHPWEIGHIDEIDLARYYTQMEGCDTEEHF